MTGSIYDVSGNETKLPQLISWDINRGSGEACDAFEVCFAFERKLLKKLADAYRFRAFEGQKTVFYGCIDEYEVSINDDGATVSVSGRSMAALLLDNETEAEEYTELGVELLISRHVTPYGIEASAQDSLPSLEGFAVTDGESEWSVVKRYCSLSGLPKPRFNAEGVLILGEGSGENHTVNDDSPVLSVTHRDVRYGIISELLVKNRGTGAKYGVKNQPFINRGGCSKRIVTMPQSTGTDALRYTAIYRIKRSAEEKFTVTLGFSEQFPMQPDDTVSLDSGRLGLKGSFKVIDVRSFASALTSGSEVTMEVVS